MRLVHIAPLAMFAALVLLGCRTEQAAQRTLGTEHENPKHTDVNNRNFRYLAGKGNVMYINGEKRLSLSIRMRLSHDSAVWLSMSIYGIEALRALVNEDSLHVLDRISKKYKVASLDSLTVLTGVPGRYELFESLLFGLPRAKEIVKEEEEIQMDWVVEYDTTSKAPKLVGARVIAKDGRELLTSEYGKHVKRGGMCLPLVSNFASTFSDSIKLDIEWTSLDTTSHIDMPFQIPEGYERSH